MTLSVRKAQNTRKLTHITQQQNTTLQMSLLRQSSRLWGTPQRNASRTNQTFFEKCCVFLSHCSLLLSSRLLLPNNRRTRRMCPHGRYVDAQRQWSLKNFGFRICLLFSWLIKCCFSRFVSFNFFQNVSHMCFYDVAPIFGFDLVADGRFSSPDLCTPVCVQWSRQGAA